MISSRDMNCIILAGGKSKRLGRNKLLEKVGGLTLLDRVIIKLSSLRTSIIVVVAADSILPDLTGYSDVKVIQDVIPGKGSLGGLYSGLEYSDQQFNLVTACDMPFLDINLFQYMISLIENNDAVVPVVNDNVEPLHAVYSKNCLTAIQSLILQNRLSILNLFPLIKVRFVNQSDIEKWDPGHKSFLNINSESDLNNAKKIAEQEG
jgi:molybdenum cofactor guanylyltransferase